MSSVANGVAVSIQIIWVELILSGYLLVMLFLLLVFPGKVMLFAEQVDLIVRLVVVRVVLVTVSVCLKQLIHRSRD